MIEPKKSIKNTPPAHHGAFDYDELARLGYSPDEVIDFSVNSNPYGPPESVREAIASVPLDRYPDRECIALREKLAEHHNTNIENIVVGNGTAELLMLIAQAFIRESDEVLVVGPTFSEYERVAKLMGANVNTFNARLNHRNEFFPPFQKIRTFIEEHQPRIAFMCNPNNPTGFTLYGRSIHNQFAEVPLAVIDEAYVNFASDLGLYKSINFDWQQSPNLLMLRSLTKDFAIAGLRLGYAVGHTDVIEAIRRVRPAWNVNAMALAAGECIVGNSNLFPKEELYGDGMGLLLPEKAELVHNLEELGLMPVESKTHYFLVNVGDATTFRSKLLQHKIMVRDCTSFGLPQYVRIATRTPEDNAKLLQAIEAIQA